MELALLVWVISMLGGFSVITLVLALVSACAAFVCFLGWTSEEVRARAIIWWAAAALFFSILLVAIPNQKTAYIMVGAYATQQIAQDPKVQQIGAKTLLLIEQKLDEYIKQEPKK